MRISIVFLLVLFYGTASAQDVAGSIRSAALPLPGIERLPDSIASRFRPFRVTMVGELHGTHEPAQFAGALAEALTRSGDSVLLGLEIEAADLGDFPARHTEASLTASPFFQGVTNDGRNSVAWRDLIIKAQANPRIQLFYFDHRGAQRDSFMAVNIARALDEHPTWKVVTLSGNMHNRVRASAGKQYAGAYLLQLQNKDLDGRLCSVNIAYNNLSMWSNDGEGLRVRTHTSNNVFVQGAPSDRYLLFLDPRSGYEYNAVLYVKDVTAAEPVNRKP